MPVQQASFWWRVRSLHALQTGIGSRSFVRCKLFLFQRNVYLKCTESVFHRTKTSKEPNPPSPYPLTIGRVLVKAGLFLCETLTTRREPLILVHIWS
ncbi:hypothetical protein CEXT_463891 [Caerostris extrusa]|uniref:Secreted protein n=1 Tax=Caerostris extrusa TaxID=172846 RepID=A0AAV4NRN7_CAEEX|nr:hypothetical protein CEXT_463891 [Caerostris extrusa]